MNIAKGQRITVTVVDGVVGIEGEGQVSVPYESLVEFAKSHQDLDKLVVETLAEHGVTVVMGGSGIQEPEILA